MRTIDFEDLLLEELKDLDYAADYLTACLEEGESVFLLGIRNVAKAQRARKALSDATTLNRESPYDTLSKSDNPLFSSVTTALDKLGFELSLKPKRQGTDAA